MARFFVSNGLALHAVVVLTKEQARHLSAVLRIHEGDMVELFDGKGGLASGRVTELTRSGAKVKILETQKLPPSSILNICFGIPKAQALDFVIRRGTEIGVAGFQPLRTAHSLHPSHWNQQRWERVVVEVCKQCEAVHLPVLLPPLALGEWLKNRNQNRLLVCCDEEQRARKTVPKSKQGYDLLVGPEGGWSQEERATIFEAGAAPLGLGKQRLRIETATLTAAVLLKSYLGEI